MKAIKPRFIAACIFTAILDKWIDVFGHGGNILLIKYCKQVIDYTPIYLLRQMCARSVVSNLSNLFMKIRDSCSGL